jgi:Na+-transporting methylmalonyl-CoA/oxaloacetate decarboxylase gamma subunit
MNFIDALIITLLGMSVVFIGLILTALLITSFGVVARVQKRRSLRTQPIARPVAPPPAVSIDEATLAVIWTVVEVERRLNRAESGGRLTIARPGEPRRSR